MFTTAASRYDAVGAVANQIPGASLAATFKPHAGDQSVGAADSAHDQALRGLEAARDIRGALAGAAGQKLHSGEAAPSAGASGSSLKSQVLDGAAGAAIFAMNPVAGAAYAGVTAVAEAAHFAANAFSMGIGPGADHAGLLHAAVNPGKSAFGPLMTKGKEKDPILSGYTDALGEEWGMGGVSASPRPGHAINARMQAAAGIVVGDLGGEAVQKQLAGASYIEKRLQQQAAAAEKAWNFTASNRKALETPALA